MDRADAVARQAVFFGEEDQAVVDNLSQPAVGTNPDSPLPVFIDRLHKTPQPVLPGEILSDAFVVAC